MSAAPTLRALADLIEVGALGVSGFSVVDKAGAINIGMELEHLPTDVDGEPVPVAAEPEPQPTAKRIDGGCPACGSFDHRDAGDGGRVCVKCSTNWNP
jgi:hypothetical protein